MDATRTIVRQLPDKTLRQITLPSMRFVSAVVEVAVKGDAAATEVLQYSPSKGGIPRDVLFPQLATTLQKYGKDSIEGDMANTSYVAFDKLFEPRLDNLTMLKGKSFNRQALSRALGPPAPSKRRMVDEGNEPGPSKRQAIDAD